MGVDNFKIVKYMYIKRYMILKYHYTFKVANRNMYMY